MVGCGISEEVYNTVVAERDATQAQVTNLQSEVSAGSGKLVELVSLAYIELTALK